MRTAGGARQQGDERGGQGERDGRALAKRGTRLRVEEVEPRDVDRDRDSWPTLSWMCGGNEATRFGAPGHLAAVCGRDLVFGAMPSLSTASASIRKYAIDSRAECLDQLDRAVNVGRSGRSAAGCSVVGADSHDDGSRPS